VAYLRLTRRSRAARLGWLYRRATARSRPLPDFLIVGAQRSGTSWTYGRLAAHPLVLGAWQKEIHFFDRERHFARGLSWYRAHFPRTGPGLLTGEATPEYMFVPAARTRLAEMVPGARLIALLRDPVERAYSQYHHNRRRGVERRSFDVALDEQPEIPAPAERGLGSYLARGRYAGQLLHLFDLFPRERVLVVRSEDLFERPADALGEIFAFLGLSGADLSVVPAEVPRYDAMTAGARARLVEYYRPHNAQLYDVLGRDMGWSR
jgi:hypothetical protein